MSPNRPSRRVPGRRRSDKSREAILKATNELLEELGFARLSIEGIAARAGVGKATIYRWWTSKGTLAIEAFLEAVTSKIEFPRTASAVADIKTQIPMVARIYRGKVGRIVRELIALSQSDPETRRLYVQGYLEPRRSAAKEVLQRGIDQGELRAGIDLDVVVDALYGPIFHRLLTDHAPVSGAFASTLVAMVLDSVAAARPHSPARSAVARTPSRGRARAQTSSKGAAPTTRLGRPAPR
ncbi:MAG: TetR/AcrR family transcriptional regulator [Proteobacteria bacterium]|nr:TetR/AcrR family transcriptional regulator [Pseudomonadota bacterium]